VEIHPLDRAIAELRRELARSPDDATVHGRLGALYYRRGDLRAAEASYRRAVELQPARASYQNNLGNVLCDLGQWREGLACYEQALALEQAAQPGRPPSPEAATNLELAKLEYRLIHERIEYLERAVQLDVGSAEALNVLGCGYLLRQDAEEALEAFRKAARLDPRNVYSARNLAFTHTLELPGPADPKAALRELDECIIRFPTQARLFIHKGELLEAAGLLEEAEGQYVRALLTDPACLEAYDVLGRLRQAVGALRSRDDTARAAESALDKLTRQSCARRRSEAPEAAAESAYHLALAAVARARFSRRPLRDPANVDALLREAQGLADPKVPSCVAAGVGAAVLRAQILESDGLRDQAALALENACARFPEAARLWFERGGLSFRQGDVERAVEAFERATLIEPQEAYAYHSLRFAFDGCRRYRTEEARFQVATRVNPRDALAHHHLGLAALSVLKDQEALELFTRALELDHTLAEAAAGRARTLQRLGRPAEAEAAAREALAIDPSSREAQRVLEALSGLKGELLLFPGRVP
jgi:tetratricopeptide (TPR) repeat protein